jgi:hypothetical protein
MAAHSPALAVYFRRNVRWLWLLMPAAVVLDSLWSFLALQVLCAMLLFAACFLAFTAFIGAFLSLVLAADSFFAWLFSSLSSFARTALLSGPRQISPSSSRATAIASQRSRRCGERGGNPPSHS